MINGTGDLGCHGAASQLRLARSMIFAAAILGAFGPITLHLTADSTNPFLFNFTSNVTQSVLVTGFLVVTRKRWFVGFFDADANIVKVRRPCLHLASFSPVSRLGTAEPVNVRINRSQARNPAGWYRIPLLWAAIGTLDYGFLAWATNYVETAVAAAVFELWPLIVVVGLARSERVDHLYRYGPSTVNHRPARPLERLLLGISAAAGIGLVFASQSPDGLTSFRYVFSYSGTAGMFLAFIAACLASASIVGTLAYGRLLYYGVVDEDYENTNRSRIDERGSKDRRLLIWLTMLGFVVARVVGFPVNIIVGKLFSDSVLRINEPGLFGAVFLGCVFAAQAGLFRVGNIAAPRPDVNALMFLSPVFSLCFLMIARISLPRFDLFLVGAALIIAINVRLQLKPEQTHGTGSREGTVAAEFADR